MTVTGLSSSLRRAMGLDRLDVAPLRWMAPVFTLSTAAAILASTATKALFLSSHALSALPWMMAASALFSMSAATTWMGAARSLSIEARAVLVPAMVAVASLACRLLFPLDPGAVSLAAYLVLPAGTALAVMQTWGLAQMLPVRQGHRMLPVLAALATLGAALGGAVVPLLLSARPAEDLFVIGALLLVGLSFLGRGAVRRMELVGPGTAVTAQAGARAPDAPPEGMLKILSHRLVFRVALVVFFAQAAAVVVEYRFSAALKGALDKDGIAQFLGGFFLVGNALVVLVSLLVARRLVRAVGVGAATLGAVVPVGALATVQAVFGGGGGGQDLGFSAATAMAAHVGHHGLARGALQSALAPLGSHRSDLARTLIDGLAYRIATVAPALALAVVGVQVLDGRVQVVFVVVACGAAIVAAVRLEAAYRSALLEELAAGDREMPPAAHDVRRLGRSVAKQIDAALREPDDLRLARIVDVAADFRLPVAAGQVEQLLGSSRPVVVVAALRYARVIGFPVEARLLKPLLKPGLPADLLVASLQNLPSDPPVELLEACRQLSGHPDGRVASAAALAGLRARDPAATTVFQNALLAAGAPGDAGGQTLAGAARFARGLLDGWKDVEPAERLALVSDMARLQLPIFAAPLLDCLALPDVRAAATAGLVALGDKAIPTISSCLGRADQALPVRVSAIRVLERLGTASALELLLECAGTGTMASRDEAAAALWRAAAAPDAPVPPAGRILVALAREIELVRGYVAVEATLVGSTPPALAPCALHALEVARQAAEDRFLRLAALVFDRETLFRAARHFRSANPRLRSMALELLETQLDVPALRGFVEHVERPCGTPEQRLASHVYRKAARESDLAPLAALDPVLHDLWARCRGGDGAVRPDRWDTIERWAVVGSTRPLAGLSPEHVLSLAAAARVTRHPAGAPVVVAGAPAEALVVVAEGEVRIGAPGGPGRAAGPGEAMLLLEILSDAAATVPAVATTETVTLDIPAAELRALTDLYADVGRQWMAWLAGELRAGQG